MFVLHMTGSLLMLSRPARKTFIYSKYRDRVYCQMHPLDGDQSALDAVSLTVFFVSSRFSTFLEFRVFPSEFVMLMLVSVLLDIE